MINLSKSQIFINGESEIILSGEVHYYRLKKNDVLDIIETTSLDNIKILFK